MFFKGHRSAPTSHEERTHQTITSPLNGPLNYKLQTPCTLKMSPCLRQRLRFQNLHCNNHETAETAHKYNSLLQSCVTNEVTFNVHCL